MFYVVEGSYAFQLGDTTVVADKGSFIHVPKGTVHGFRNIGVSPGKLMDCHTPGGFERFFEEAGCECTDADAGPPNVAPDMAKVVALFEKHGMTLSPPSR